MFDTKGVGRVLGGFATFYVVSLILSAILSLAMLGLGVAVVVWVLQTMGVL
jgi:hypothetical protein